MIKALQFLSDKNQSFSKNYLLVGDSDFLYLFIKNQIVKNSVVAGPITINATVTVEGNMVVL